MEEVKRNNFFERIKSQFFRRIDESEKVEVNWSLLKVVGISFVVLFVGIVLLLPTEHPVEFTQKIEPNLEKTNDRETDPNAGASNVERDDIWASPRPSTGVRGETEVNHNTSMVLGPAGKNAKTMVRPGQRLPLQIVDKFVVSDSPVPVLAQLLLSTYTESGLNLPAGTKFYGEASFQRGQERAQIRFTQISLPDGRMRPIVGLALGKDGQPGVEGRVYSDGAKNTAGQVITTFVAGLAAGSVETDMFGNSRGGIQNGLLSAVATTAKDRAQSYGEKLKAEREWIEVGVGTECDATLTQSLSLQAGDDE